MMDGGCMDNSTMAKEHHFLLVSLAGLGQLNPTRQLARRIASRTGSRVTVTTPLYAYRRLFPNSTSLGGEPDDASEENPLNPDGSGIVAYAPYTDGFDDGFHPHVDDGFRYMSELVSVGSRTLSSLVRALTRRGRPVTVVLYTILLTWAADIARDLGVPAIHYWIQPASVFAIYYHYFSGHPAFASPSATKDLPGLPPLREKDLPSILISPSPYLSAIIETFAELRRSWEGKPKILVNTFHELEAPAIEGVSEMELVAMGPVAEEGIDTAEEGGYTEWLDEQEERSVVYVAFGSLSRATARQAEEMERGLRESGRPYLCVLREDARSEGVEIGAGEEGKGLVVKWCSQLGVLGHRAVGCFVTHCGWNSMTEALLTGVPMVMMPGWMDQKTNARLAEAMWGVGVRPEEGADGVVEAAELRRCIDLVMGDGLTGEMMRRRANEWREKAVAAISDDGSSTKSLNAFLKGLL